MDERERTHPTPASAPASTPPPAERRFAGRFGLAECLLIAAGLWLVWALSEIVLLVFLAALLAMVLRGASVWVGERVHLPFRLVLTVIMLLVLLAGIGLGDRLGPELVRQGRHLMAQVSQQIRVLRGELAHTAFRGSLTAHGAGGQAGGFSLMAPARLALGVTFQTFADLLVLVVTMLYFAGSPALYVEGIVRLVPISYRQRAQDILHETAQVLRLWVLGQLIDMLTVGVLVAAGLTLIGVPDAYALAVLAGLLTFVPYFGAIAAGIPAVILALAIGWSTALWTLLVYVACHVIEGYLVSPLLQRRLVALPPALSVISMSIMGLLFGPLGVVLGTPAAAAVLVLVRELYVVDMLGDESMRRKAFRR